MNREKEMIRMPLLIKTLKVLVAIFVAIALCLALIYMLWLSPQKRAEKHLAFVHKSIGEMHPAVVDPNATEFQAWYQTGFESAKALLPLVKSVNDERALLNFYLAGYKESHLAGGFAYSAFKVLDTENDKWAGWVLQATSKGYRVSYSLDGDQYPKKGMEIISCDNQPIEALLQKFYAPYFDVRWNIYRARDIAAQALTLNLEYLPVLNRPVFEVCLFKNAAGQEQGFSLTWQPLSPDAKKIINQDHHYPYALPRVEQKENDVLWIHAQDFKLQSSDAFKAHQSMLEQLKLNKGEGPVVFDLRGNQGGNSDFGNEILSALFGEDGIRYLATSIVEKYGQSMAYYRPSWSFYWSRDYMIKQLIKAQGENSSNVQWLSAVNARMKKALDNHEKTFAQNEADISSEEVNKSEDSVAAVWATSRKVFVITDRHCVSSCLDFMDLLKQIPGMRHWGEPTNADTVYTEVADMWHEYHKEAYSFIVPVKQWSARPRKDNEPYIPDVIFEGNIFDDTAVEEQVLNYIRSIH